MLAYADLADFLADGGAVVAGATALAATGVFVGAALRRDIGENTAWGRRRGWQSTDIYRATERGAIYGGLFGACVLVTKLAAGG